MSICCICGTDFAARHSYGLCPSCFSKDAAREIDRIEISSYKAHKSGVIATLTLREWLSAVSDAKGLCAWCQEYTYSVIEMVDPAQGLTYDNVVPSCKACSTRRAEGYRVAEERVRWYLSTDRTPQDTAQNEEETK